MKLFDIITDTKILKQISEEVKLPLSKEDEELVLDMVEYLRASQDEELSEKYNIRPGVGLAAIQLGIKKRMLAVCLVEEKKTTSYALVNPVIVSHSVRECFLNTGEGCLSVPIDVDGYVYRPYKVTIKAYDAITKKKVTIKARGYLSIILQHEMDHLDGILYYERIDKKEPFRLRQGAEVI